MFVQNEHTLKGTSPQTALIRCGIKPSWAGIYGDSSKGYRANAEGIMHHAASNDKLRAAGYPCLMDCYVRLHVR